MSFQATHLTKKQTIQLAASPEHVFPLFTPLGEKRWVAGWNPEIVYPASGEAQTGMVFKTQPAEDFAIIWTVADYQPEQFYVAYIRVLPELRVDRIEVRCEDRGDGTQATVTYTFTGLTTQGNFSIAKLSETHDQSIAHWQDAINYYLQYGQALSRH